MTDGKDKSQAEFVSEAQELIEALSRNLTALERALPTGTEEPEQLNEAFRNVHTLKGLSGLFNQRPMGELSHSLEDLLDKLRLGRLQLSVEVLDQLFAAVDAFWHLLSQGGNGTSVSLAALLARLDALTPAPPEAPTNDLEGYALDPELLSVLTEYEEHRLQLSIKQGLALVLVRVRFELATLDTQLSAVKSDTKPFGEVLTYLPAGDNADPACLDLDLLIATGQVEEVKQVLGSAASQLRVIGRTESAARPELQPAGATEGRQLSHAATQDAALARSPSPSQPIAHPSAAPGALVRSISQTVRVDIRKLDELMNVLAKLSVLRGALGELSETARAEGDRQMVGRLHHLSHQFSRNLRELQGGLLDVRMVPLTQVFERLTRVVRQTGRELDKDVHLVVTGADTEIDKLIVEELSDPLMHIVRNAVDHGIEDRQSRDRRGKPRGGTIALNAFQKGNHVVIEAEDDGCGVDTESLVRNARSLGLISVIEASEMSRDEALNLIFHPGLSTRATATAVSGRGVGMDVVRTNIAKLGGSVELDSERQIGTKITLTLPLTRAIVTALVVLVGDSTFAVPLNSIAEVARLDPARIRRVDNAELLSRRDSTLELRRLRELFNLGSARNGDRDYVVEVKAGPRRLGLVVDALQGQQDIIIRPLGASLDGVRGFSGASELGDERIALVLDPGALIDEAGAEASATARNSAAPRSLSLP